MPFFLTKPLSIGFTGAQQGILTEQAAALLKLLTHLKITEDAVIFHHGDCIGADALSHQFATALGFHTVAHPCWIQRKRAFCIADEIHPSYDPLVRNKHIVNDSDQLIATPRFEFEELHSGTWSTVRYARKLQRPVYIIMPDGRVDTERMSMVTTQGI